MPLIDLLNYSQLICCNRGTDNVYKLNMQHNLHFYYVSNMEIMMYAFELSQSNEKSLRSLPI